LIYEEYMGVTKNDTVKTGVKNMGGLNTTTSVTKVGVSKQQNWTLTPKVDRGCRQKYCQCQK